MDFRRRFLALRKQGASRAQAMQETLPWLRKMPAEGLMLDALFCDARATTHEVVLGVPVLKASAQRT